jgi:hypothetical protein
MGFGRRDATSMDAIWSHGCDLAWTLSGYMDVTLHGMRLGRMDVTCTDAIWSYGCDLARNAFWSHGRDQAWTRFFPAHGHRSSGEMSDRDR